VLFDLITEPLLELAHQRPAPFLVEAESLIGASLRCYAMQPASMVSKSWTKAFGREGLRYIESKVSRPAAKGSHRR